VDAARGAYALPAYVIGSLNQVSRLPICGSPAAAAKFESIPRRGAETDCARRDKGTIMGQENIRSGDYTADSANTVREHAGEALEDTRNWPGYLCIGLALAALGLTLTAGAYGFGGWVWIGAIAAVALLAAGLTIVLLERKRVNAREGRDLTEPGAH
jgi:hypothetical protein